MIGWEMVEAIKRVELNNTKEVMQGANFLSLHCDEVTSVDCQSWVNVHGYILRDWKRIPLLFMLDRAVEGGTLDNLTTIIVNVICTYGGLSDQKRAARGRRPTASGRRSPQGSWQSREFVWEIGSDAYTKRIIKTTTKQYGIVSPLFLVLKSGPHNAIWQTL